MAGSEIIGGDRLARTMHAAADDLGDFTAANRDAARLIKAEALRRVPRRTGRLAQSVQTTAEPAQAVVRFGGPSVRYAAPINWGVGPRVGLRGPHNIRPTRFATGAVESVSDQLVARYLDDLNTDLSTVKGA